MTSAQHYLRNLILSGTATFVSLLVFIILADPYGIYGTPVWRGLTADKYHMNKFERVIKSVMVSHRRPVVIILGSSRAAVGLRPAFFKGEAGNVYNFAFNAASLDEIESAYHHASRASNIRTVIIGLDYFSFTIIQPGNVASIRRWSHGGAFVRWQIYAEMTVNLTAISDSFLSYMYNIRSDPPSHDENGMYVGYDPHNVPFRGVEVTNKLPSQDNYAAFERILVHAEKNRISLKLFVSPTYMSHDLHKISYVTWKRKISTMAKRHGFRIYDAGADKRLTIVRANFLDLSHYRPHIGDKILNALFPHYTPSNRLPR